MDESRVYGIARICPFFSPLKLRYLVNYISLFQYIDVVNLTISLLIHQLIYWAGRFLLKVPRYIH